MWYANSSWMTAEIWIIKSKCYHYNLSIDNGFLGIQTHISFECRKLEKLLIKIKDLTWFWNVTLCETWCLHFVIFLPHQSPSTEELLVDLNLSLPPALFFSYLYLNTEVNIFVQYPMVPLVPSCFLCTYFLCVSWLVYGWGIFLCVSMQKPMCVYMQKPKGDLGSSSSIILFLIPLRQGLSLRLKFSRLARLTPKSSSIYPHFVVASKWWSYRYALG